MITVQTIEEKDLPALACLYRELLEEPTDLSKMQEVFQKIKDNPDYIILAAKNQDGALVGSLLSVTCMDIIADCRPFMVLENIIVKSDCRSMGIGKALMGKAEDIARKRRCAYIMLVSSGFRKQAHLFYDAMGYKPDEVKGFRKYLEE